MKKVKNVKRIITIGIAAVLVAALSVGLMIGSAADTGTLTAQSEYVCRIVSDDMTNTPPYASAGVTGGFGSRESDGRVWVDKSVTANDASNAFDVTLSALAQEYSYSEEAINTIMEQNAADVLFILDFSGSMVTNSMKNDSGKTVGTRLQVLAESLNAAMKEIAEVNPYNRIMAVAFDQEAYDFLPLGVYKAPEGGNYVTFANNTISTAPGVKFTGTYKGVKYNETDSLTFSKAKGSGTHMQIGITYGCDQLLQSMSNDFGEGKRLPFVMVMTDGESNYSHNNWAGTNLKVTSKTSSPVTEANSTLAATFWKKRLIDAYNLKNAENEFEGSVNAVWFNIGVGLGDPGEDGTTAKAVQVSMKPAFANPTAPSTSAAGKIYSQILKDLEAAYNNPQNYVGDPLNGYDDLLARDEDIDVAKLREDIAAALANVETEFNTKLENPNSDESQAIKAAGEKAKTDAYNASLEKTASDAQADFQKSCTYNNYTNKTRQNYYDFINANFTGEFALSGSAPFSKDNNDKKLQQEVKNMLPSKLKAVGNEAKATKAATDAATAAGDAAVAPAEAAKKAELLAAAKVAAEEQAILDALGNQDLTMEDLNDAVQGYFEKFLTEYMGYTGNTQTERQSEYAKNPMHYFAEYVNYADTSNKVNDSFDDLSSLIAAATAGTVIPITHHSTTGVAADEIFITFTDPIGEGTTIKTDADGNYIMTIVLDGVTYTGRPKAGATEGVYEFYNSDKVLNSTATIAGGEVKWEINAYELPIIRFADRMLPGTPVEGKIYEDPNLAPIQVKYEVVPTADALANTATNGNYIYEHDYDPADEDYVPARAVFTPTSANTYYFTNLGTETEPIYEKVTDMEETILKKTNANKSETADFSSDYAWGTGDDDGDFVILLGNDARTKVLAEVSIEDDRPEDTDDYNAHEYFSDESITYTLKVKNLSDEQLKNLTYTLNVNPSGPTATDTPSALTIGTCSTEPDNISTDKKTLTWELDVLDPGETEINTVTVTPAKGTKNGTNVDAVITLTKVFKSDLVTPATDETGEKILAENATVNTYLDGAKKNIGTGTGAIPSSPSALYIKTDDGEYFALTKSNTGVYTVSNIPLGEYTIYDGNSGTPNALGKVTVIKGGTNEGNIYWKTINMEKVWDDNDNQDGKRPSKVTFNLKKKTGESTTADVASYDITGTTWKKSAVVLDKDENGNTIEYVLTETAIEGYEATVDGFKVTNKHTPVKADVTMKKVWDDGNDQDGKRPASVTFTLYKKVGTAAKTQLGDPYTFSGTGNEWTKTVSQLPVYEGGKTIVYSVEEANINVEGYTASTSTDDPLTIKNSYTPEETSITLKKVWDDGNDQDGIRPTSVDFILYKQTEDMNTPEPIDVLSLSSADNWTLTVSGLPKNQSGKLITYTVDEETVPEGYTKSINGLTVKNSYTPKTKSITVTKVWDDADFVGKTGYIRPSVEIVLTAKVDNVKVDSLCKTATLTAADVNAENENEWLYTFTDLPVNSGGKEIAYTISETTLAAYKTPTIDNDNYKITNTPKDVSEAYNPLTIPLIKVDYHFTNAGLKDTVITATATGITIVSAPTDADGISSLTFEKPEYYSVVETTPPTGYMLNNAAYKVVIDKNFNSMAYDATSGKWVWTYDLVLDTEQSAKLIGGKLRFQDRPIETSVVLKKVWDDNSDQDGKRPDSVKLTLYKTVNNVKTEVKDVTISKPATFSNTWTYTEEKLPTYEGGYPVTYTVEEKVANVDSNYTNTDSDLTDLIVTNKHVPETTSITLKKQWNDNSDQDGLRPDEITLRLNKTVGDKTEKVGDYTFSGEGDNWTKEITGLPVYEAGSKIKYTADEPTVPNGYEKATDGLAVRNSHTPEVTDVTVKKIWDDQNDADEIRPESVALTLYKTVNGVADKVGDITLDETDGSGNTWEWTEEELPVYEDGYKITYTVDELNVPTNYTKTIDGLTVKNSHGPVRNVYVTYSEGGSVSNGNAEVDFGGDYQTIVTPDDGYVIDTVTINDVKVPRRDDGTYKIENITEDQYIVISFAEDSIGGGDDLDEGDGIPDKYQATVTYKVVNGTWADDSADPIKKVFDMATNTTGAWENVTPTPTLGTTVPTGMKPDEKHITNNAAWDKTCTADVTVVDGSVYTYTFPDYLKHRIDISVTNGTKDITEDYVLVIHKDDQSLSFAPNTGYALDTVTVDGEPAVLKADGSYDFTTVIADHEIVVVYATDVIGGGDNLDESDGIPDKYQAIVTYKVVNGTWADGNDDDIDALFNTHVYQDGVWTALNPTLGTTVPTGMLPDDIHIAPGSWDKTTTSSVAVVDKDVFTFTFDQYLTFDITINVTGGTHDAGDDEISVIHKDSKTIQFTPDDGKVIKSVVIDGVEVSITDDLTYTFDNVSEDHTITVVFADDKNDNGIPDEFEADITYQVANGTWEDGTTEDIVEHFILKELKDGFWVDTNATLGDTIPVGMLPDDFHVTDSSAWSMEIDGTTAVTGNATYLFNFGEEKYHNITIDITGGTTDPDEEIIPVKHKDEKTIVITPDEHHVVDKIIINGTEVTIPDDLTLVFEEIVDDLDIQIICEEDLNDDHIADKYQAEVTIVENKEAGDTTGAGIFIKGDTVTVISTLNDGYQFIGWMVDGKIVSTDLEYSFPLNSDVKLIPIYEKIVIPETTTTTTKANEKPESPDTGDVAGRVAGILLAISAAAWLLTSSKKRAE